MNIQFKVITIIPNAAISDQFADTISAECGQNSHRGDQNTCIVSGPMTAKETADFVLTFPLPAE